MLEYIQESAAGSGGGVYLYTPIGNKRIKVNRLYSRFTFNKKLIYFSIKFYNNLNILIKDLILSNIDLIILIDNLNNIIENNLIDINQIVYSNNFERILINIYWNNNSNKFILKLKNDNIEILNEIISIENIIEIYNGLIYILNEDKNYKF
jgi:hypothetical protein